MLLFVNYCDVNDVLEEDRRLAAEWENSAVFIIFSQCCYVETVLKKHEPGKWRLITDLSTLRDLA